MKSLNDVHARAEEDVLAVVRPAHDDVVRPHAVGDFVAAERGGVGEPLRHAALGGHDVDLGVAVVLAGEGDLLAVGREAGEHLEAFVAGQPAGDAAGGRHGVQVAGVGEDDLVAVDGREAEQPGLGLVGAATSGLALMAKTNVARRSRSIADEPRVGMSGLRTGTNCRRAPDPLSSCWKQSAMLDVCEQQCARWDSTHDQARR